VDKEIEALGVKVLSQHAVLGPYDFVNVVEAPNNETIGRASVELGSRETIQIISMPRHQLRNSSLQERKSEELSNWYLILNAV
jgi:uncharacterized protein with GYD domain